MLLKVLEELLELSGVLVKALPGNKKRTAHYNFKEITINGQY